MSAPERKPFHREVLGAFVVYCKCGKSVTGCQVDFGPAEPDQDDGGMLLDALRDGRRMEYRKGSPVRVSVGGSCECNAPPTDSRAGTSSASQGAAFNSAPGGAQGAE